MESIIFSKQIAERFERLKIWRRFIAVTYLLIYFVYLIWRSTIFSQNSLFLSFFYFIAECFGFVLSLTVVFNTWKYKRRSSKKIPPNLIVDVFILTYLESIEIIKKTVLAAKEIEYPHQLWIFDDGHREDIKQFSKEVGVNYFSRQNNTHAKAGNLNFGLSKTSGEFIMVLDADHIVLPHSLDVTIGYFDDKKVAMVQTPQDYYNIDAFQYINNKHKVWHDQSFFYDIAQSCNDTYNGSSCVGTGVIYRRSVLNEIGGFPSLTVTEDIHTSLLMHKAGYQSVYVNEPIAYGVAAADLSEYYKSRHRWAHGNLNVLKHEQILSCKGLSWQQRISYLSLGLIYLEGWQKIILLIIPVITLIVGLSPFEISIFNVLVVLFFPFLSYTMLYVIGCGFSNFLANEIFAIIRWPIHLISTAGLFGKKIPWISSSKNIKSKLSWRLMIPQLLILIVSIFSIIVALYKLKINYEVGPIYTFITGYFESFIHLFSFTNNDTSYSNDVYINKLTDINIYTITSEGYSVDLVIIAGLWVFYNIIMNLVFIKKIAKNFIHSKKYFQFKIPLPVIINNKGQGETIIISEDFLKLNISYGKSSDYPIGSINNVDLCLLSKTIKLNIEIVKLSISNNKKILSIEAKINYISEIDKNSLNNCIYSANWHHDLFLNKREVLISPIKQTIFKYITLGFFKPTVIKKWNSMYYFNNDVKNNNQRVAYISNTINKDGLRLIAVFEELELNEHITGHYSLKTSNPTISFKIVKSTKEETLYKKCLDKSIMRYYLIQVIYPL